jgi:hypothetical protein
MEGSGRRKRGQQTEPSQTSGRLMPPKTCSLALAARSGVQASDSADEPVCHSVTGMSLHP